MPHAGVLTYLLGGEDVGFRGSKWSNDPAVFRSNPKWFQRLSSLDVFRDPEQWFDRACMLRSFPKGDALARSDQASRAAAQDAVLAGADGDSFQSPPERFF